MPPPAAARNVTEIETAMSAVAGHPSGLCTKHEFTSGPTHDGRKVSYLRVTKGTGTKPVLAIIGGVHAREVAPPDILVDFAKELVEAAAGNRDASYPAFTDPSAPPVTYAPFSVPAASIQDMVSRLEIYIVPLVNPDGRAFVLASPVNHMWRGNRRPNLPGPVVGVDLNRNFPIAWPFDKYYSVLAVGAGNVGASHSTADPENYVGTAVPEPETANVRWLIETKKVSFFLDLHSHGRKVMYPWSIESNQHLNATQSFQNAMWDRTGATGGRDGIPGTPPDPSYAEFFPNAAPGRLFDEHVAIATAICDAIRASAGPDATAIARSTYLPEQSIGIGYLSPGASDDYAFSRQFTVAGHPPVRAFTIECGSDLHGESKFHPPYPTKFPKIEREVHAGLFAFLKEAAKRSPAPAPPPAPAPAPKGGSGACFVLAVLGVTALHPEAVALRRARDRATGRPGMGGSCARAGVRLYERWSPGAAALVARHPLARRVLRTALLRPLARLALGARSGR